MTNRFFLSRSYPLGFWTGSLLQERNRIRENSTSPVSSREGVIQRGRNSLRLYFPYNGRSYWIIVRALLIGVRSPIVPNGPCKQGYEGAMMRARITAVYWVGLFHHKRNIYKREIIKKLSCKRKNSKVLVVIPCLHTKMTRLSNFQIFLKCLPQILKHERQVNFYNLLFWGQTPYFTSAESKTNEA